MGMGCWATWSLVGLASEAWVDSGSNSGESRLLEETTDELIRSQSPSLPSPLPSPWFTSIQNPSMTAHVSRTR